MRYPSLFVFSLLSLTGALVHLAACADSQEVAFDAGPGSSSLAGSSSSAESAGRTQAPSEVPFDWRPVAEDFTCLTEWSAVRGLFLTNVLGELDGAIEAAEEGFEREVPPGTIIQLVPFEAMAKLAPGASPQTGDWEFLLLETTRNGTEITERGGAEVSNQAGSCLGCHAGARDRDMVCEQTGLCDAAALSRDLVDLLVSSDPRCR